MKKITNMIAGVVIIFFLPIAVAQFFPFSGFSPTNNLPNQQGNYLQLIAMYTYGTLLRVNSLPTFIEQWLKLDKTDATANKFGNFVKLGKPAQDALSTALKLTGELIGKDIPDDANDYTFSSLLGNPIKYPDPRKNPPDPEYAYLKTSSGGLLTLPVPQAGESNQAARAQYKVVYQTLISAISYNNYLMTKINNEMKSQNKTMAELIKQSTDEQWIKDIGGKLELGVIFRQMLLYISQSYVLQTRVVEMQREMTMSQIFTNTLLALSIQNGIMSITNATSSSSR